MMIDENSLIQEVVNEIKRTETVDFSAFAGHPLSHPIVIAFINHEAERSYNILKQILYEEYSAYSHRICFVTLSENGTLTELPGIKGGYTKQSILDVQDDIVDLNRVVLFNVDDTSGDNDLNLVKVNLKKVREILAADFPGVSFVSWLSVLADSGASLTPEYIKQCQNDPNSFSDGGSFVIENKLGNGAVYNKSTNGWETIYRLLSCVIQLVLDCGDTVVGNSVHILRFVEERKPYNAMALGTVAAFATNVANRLHENSPMRSYGYEDFALDFGFSAGRSDFVVSCLEGKIQIPNDEIFYSFPKKAAIQPPENDATDAFFKAFNSYTSGTFFAFIDKLFDEQLAEDVLNAFRDYLLNKFTITKIFQIRSDKNKDAYILRLKEEVQRSVVLKNSLEVYARDNIYHKYTQFICEKLESIIEDLYAKAKEYQNSLNYLLTRILSKPRNDTAKYFFNKALTQSGNLSAIFKVSSPEESFLTLVKNYVMSNAIFAASYEDLLRTLSQDEHAQATTVLNRIMSDDNLMNRFYNSIGASYTGHGHFSGVTLFCNPESKIGKQLASDFHSHGFEYRICSTTSISGVCAIRVFTHK